VSAIHVEPTRSERLLPVAAALVTVVLWSSAFVGIRSAGRDLDPGPLALLRLVVGSLGLGALMLTRRQGLPPRRALRGIVICGVLWFGFYNLALNDAERRLDAGTAAMLVNIGPVLIALLAAAVLDEGLPRQLLAGCLVAFAGAAVIGLAGSGHGLAPSWGALLCIAAACSYSVGVVAQKPALEYASPLQATWLACCIGTVVCLPFAPSLVRELGTARASSIGWTIYLGALPTAVGFITWAYALSRTTAGRMGATTYLVPPLAILLSWAILDQTPQGVALAGGALCLVGVAFTRRRPGARRAAAHAAATVADAAVD
jgi:drug/metabolite transporter (DMT)-like permease